MTAAVNVPVIVRKMVQFREGSLGRKFSPNPRYFHTGFGGLRGLAAFASIGISGLGVEETFGCYRQSCQLNAVWEVFTSEAGGGFESAMVGTVSLHLK